MRKSLLLCLSLWALCAFTTTVKAEEVNYTDSIKNAAVTSLDSWEKQGNVSYGDGLVKLKGETFDFYQTIMLPAGQYKVTAQAAYRYGSGEVDVAEPAEYNAIQNKENTHLAKLYAEVVSSSYTYEANVQNRWEGRATKDYFNDRTKVSAIEVEGVTYYVPNSSAAVKCWFDSCKYVNELIFNVQEKGKVKIGIAKTQSAPNGDYTNIGAWTLTRIGDAEADPEVKEDEEDEGEEVTFEPGQDITEKIVNAKVVSADGWTNGSTANGQQYTGAPDNTYLDWCNWSGSVDSRDMYQTIADMPAGYYTLKVATRAHSKMDGTIYVTTDVKTYSAEIHRVDNSGNELGGGWGWTVIEYFVMNATGDMTIGFKTTAPENGVWAGADNFTLIYIGSLTDALDASKKELKAVIDAANTVSPAVESLTVAITQAQEVYDSSTSIEEVKGATETLEQAIVLANNTNAVASATMANPVVTNFVVNGKFDTNGVTDPWKYTTGATNHGTATNQGGAFTGYFFENWNGSNYTGKIYQEIENIPNGWYELSICAFVETFDASAQFVYANADKVALTVGAPTAYTVLTYVEDNKIEIGFEQTVAVNRWSGIDNISLKYFGENGGDSKALFMYEYTKANGEALLNEKMLPAILEKLKAALTEAGTVDKTSDVELEAATEALTLVIEEAEASVNSHKILAAGVLPDNSLEGWTCTNTNKFEINTWSTEGNSDGTGMVTPFIQNWVGKESVLGSGTISYTLPGVESGYYKASALIRVYSEANNDIKGASFFANDVKTEFATGKPFVYNNMRGIYDTYTAVVNVGEDGVLKFGVEIADDRTFNWVAFKNVKIEYIGIIDQAAAEALKAKIPTTPYDAALAAEIKKLVADVDAEVTYENYLALTEKIALAEASAAAYASNKLAIDAMYDLMASTNVYTDSVYLAYKSIADGYMEQYEAGTLDATVDNPAAVHGHHAKVDYDSLLLSAFGIPEDDWASLHINTWSKEGESDGSEFKVPFYEYWTVDADSLAVDTFTATMAGLVPDGFYSVEAWVRVRARNNVAPAEATGITLTAGNGTPVDVTNGAVVPNSQFSHAVYTAYGFADKDGKLAINFNVLKDNNVSWLSFKNLKYKKESLATDSEKQAFKESIAKAEGYALGFAAGEYAPYANAEALEALAAAKRIDIDGVIASATLKAAQEALDTATWTVNTEEMNAIYNGDFAESKANATSGVDVDVPGWTWVEGMRMVVDDVTKYPALSATEGKKAMFAWGNANCVYGNQAGYTISLEAETVYEFSFKYAGWADGEMRDVTFSILYADTMGLKESTAAAPTKRITEEGAFVEHSTRFTTGKAGDYVLRIKSGGHVVFTDFKLYTIPVEKVTLDKESIEFLAPDSVVQLVATVSPEEATYKTITWATSDAKVATVDQTGKVTSVRPGEAIITATAPNGKADTCKVTVDFDVIEVENVTLDKETIEFLSSGAIEQLTATVDPVDATDKTITWATSDAKVATVDQTGKVTSVRNGKAFITATASNGKADTCVVTVTFAVVEVEKVELNKDSVLFVAAGSTEQLTATVSPDDATYKAVTWTTSDAKVATVDAEGKVTSVADGTALIIATVENGKADTCVVTVAIPVEVEKVTLSKAAIEFTTVGATEQLIATVSPDNATDKAITWTTSDEKVATVDKEGKVTSVGNGTATITATASNGVKATCVVTVAIPVAEITLSADSIHFVAADSTVQLIATVSPEDAVAQEITWSSSDENVATVDAEGKVTSVAAGTAIIKAATANGVEATCVVTVVITDGIENIYVDGEQVIYDLSGRRVTEMVKGFYIVNGKKVLVK